MAWASDDLTLELASITGSTSLEDHYWNSGWQTANVQLLTQLRMSDSILDIGCGVGRLAHGLYRWFGGRYVGVDIMARLIEFCHKRFPRFEFHHLDVRSALYNPNGTMDPRRLVLPAGAHTFDVAVLFSVFTHLLPEELSRLTTEVGRVLKPNGRCLATFFILDEMTESARYKFPHSWDVACRVEKRESPQDAVAYRKSFVLDQCAGAGLEMTSFYRGAWTGREGLGVQDEIVFRKMANR